jgi:pyruvate formate lyase activating enzyme
VGCFAEATQPCEALAKEGCFLNRRGFIQRLLEYGVGTAAATLLYEALAHPNLAEAAREGVHLPPIDAQYSARLSGRDVECHLCPRQERLSPGQLGACRARTNIGGAMKTYASGQPCVLNVDPIEKNPACHFLPGSKVLTIAHAGCNLRCLYCQNWEFSQKNSNETNNLRFDQGEALQLATQKQLAGVTFTYTEGTSHIEFNKKFAEAAHKVGFRVYLCSNGYIQERPLTDFLELLDGVTITIKGFRDSFYSKYIGVPSVKPVLESCKRVRKSGKWLEIATLVVGGVNDSDEELRSIAGWIRENLGPQTPWHLERFVPKFMLSNLPQTPVKTLERARDMGLRAGLKFVYISNVAPHSGNHTYCPKCGKAVIERLGFKVLQNRLRDGHCPACSTSIPGVWG